MSQGTKGLLVIAASLAIVAAAISTFNRPDVRDKPTPAVTSGIPEDSHPSWDCRTMGNRTCGPSPR